MKRISVTERDIKLFHLLQKFGFLNLKLARKLCFPDTNAKIVNRRLKKLTDYKLLRRIAPPGRADYWYYIGENLREYLGNERPLKKAVQSRLMHDSGLAEVMAGLYLNYSDDNAEVSSETDFLFFGRHIFRSVKEYRGKTRSLSLNFLPDGSILFKEFPALYFIEYDRSTEWGVQLRQKLWAYEEYFEKGIYKKDFGEDLSKFRVLMLCKDEKRISSVMKAYSDNPGGVLFVFSTHQEFLEAEKPLHTPIWTHSQKQNKFALWER